MKRLLSQFALVLLLPGCRQTETETAPVEASMMFSAGICLPASTTKVCPDMNSAGDIPVYWETGDRVRIMDDRGESIYITEDSGTASARFAFDKSLEGNRRLNASDSYLGFYPDRNWLQGVFTMPEEQRNDRLLYPMAAHSTGNSLEFSGICSIVRLRLHCIDKTCKPAVIRNITAGAYRDIGGITGQMGADGVITWESTKSDGFKIGRPLKLECAYDSADERTSTEESRDYAATGVPVVWSGTDEEEDYYMVMPPLDYEGLAFQIESGSGWYVYAVPGNTALLPNRIYTWNLPMEAFDRYDEPVLAEGKVLPPLTDISYVLACEQDSIAITSSNQSGEIDVSSIKYRKYSDGQEFTSTIGFTVDISSDDGATYHKEATGIAVTTDSTFQNIRYEISIATGKDIDSTEITESIAKCSYIVRLTQVISGKRLYLRFSSG